MRAWQSARGPAGVTESLQHIIVFSLFVVLVSQHTAIPCPCLSLSEPLRVRDPSTASQVIVASGLLHPTGRL